METKFLTFSEKMKLIKAVEERDEAAVSAVIGEISRLETLVRNYESLARQTAGLYKETTNKKPKTNT